MLNKIAKLGQTGFRILDEIGASGWFLISTFCRVPNLRKLWPHLVYQMHFLGMLSLLIIVVSALFIGMVVGLQGYHTLEKFGASSQLGQLLALSIVRELGPVLSALLFAGRAGSALTSEIGLMKATEQIDSMEMMGVSPLERIVMPRFISGLIALPILSIIFCAVSIYGGYLIGVVFLNLDAGTFWSNMQVSVHLKADILGGILKSVVFAFVTVWIALFLGIRATPTPEGIGQATTQTVVFSSLAILGLDFVLTAMMIGEW